MKKIVVTDILVILCILTISACGNVASSDAGNIAGEVLFRDDLKTDTEDSKQMDQLGTGKNKFYTVNTKISDVAGDPVFGNYGRLIFPVDERYYSGNTLGELQLKLYNNIDPDKTVEIVNYMRKHAEAGDIIFYDIYTDEEKASDPTKEDTGLFFFKGNAGERFAVCNAGGGFAYVGAMHDSFPHALELSKMGYNAFALIYRPGWDMACEDLARAISFIFEHAEELNVDTDCYSLWGGSAGARMAALLGAYGPVGYGGGDLPRPGAVIMQYTGHTEYTENDPLPTLVSEQVTESLTGRQCRGDCRQWRHLAYPQNFMSTKDLGTVLGWVRQL